MRNLFPFPFMGSSTPNPEPRTPSLCAIFIPLLLFLGLAACQSTHPDARTGPVLDASRNLASALYYPRSRPDNPSPVQTFVFVRHFYYFSRMTQWTILSSGDTAPATRFEETALYRLRLVPSTSLRVSRLLEIPGLRTEGVTAPRVHVAIAAPAFIDEDGNFLNRNTTDAAIVYVEDGPLYGDIRVDLLDTDLSSALPPRLLVAGRVRAAALATDGVTVAYVDDVGRLFVMETTGQAPDLVFDLRLALGPVSVLAIQWDIRVPNRVLVRLDRGLGLEAWAVSVPDRQLTLADLNPEDIEEPGSDRLSDVDGFTRTMTPQDWGVPDPRGFSP